jgi:hypothetical protein
MGIFEALMVVADRSIEALSAAKARYRAGRPKRGALIGSAAARTVSDCDAARGSGRN